MQESQWWGTGGGCEETETAGWRRQHTWSPLCFAHIARGGTNPSQPGKVLCVPGNGWREGKRKGPGLEACGRSR